jgi:hypothetical protein
MELALSLMVMQFATLCDTWDFIAVLIRSAADVSKRYESSLYPFEELSEYYTRKHSFNPPPPPPPTLFT